MYLHKNSHSFVPFEYEMMEISIEQLQFPLFFQLSKAQQLDNKSYLKIII